MGMAEKYVFLDTSQQFATNSSIMKDELLVCNKRECLSLNCNIIFGKECHVRQQSYDKRILVEHAPYFFNDKSPLTVHLGFTYFMFNKNQWCPLTIFDK